MAQEKLFTHANVFEFKGVNLTILSFLLKTNDMEVLERELIQKFKGQQAFFDGDSIVIDLSEYDRLDQNNTSEINFTKLIDLLKKFNLAPIGVKSTNKKNLAAAQKYGLFSSPDLFSANNAFTRNPAVIQTGEVITEKASSRSKTISTEDTLVINHPLRSGQQIYARGRDVIILSAVNVGAEIIADGNIHVYAPLRGRAIAGAKGNKKARIFTMSLNAELLSIAGIYRTAEDNVDSELIGKPAEIRLESSAEEDRLIINPL